MVVLPPKFIRTLMSITAYNRFLSLGPLLPVSRACQEFQQTVCGRFSRCLKTSAPSMKKLLHQPIPCRCIMKFSSGRLCASPKGQFKFSCVAAFLVLIWPRPTNKGNFCTAAYKTMSMLISHSAQDTLPIVQSLVLAILQWQEHLLTIQNQILGINDRTNWNELQSNFCSILVVSLAYLCAHW